jgi:hypothetical protein
VWWWCLSDLSLRGTSTPPFISKEGEVIRKVTWLQHDTNQDSICTCLFYIYFCRYSYLCLRELVLVFWNLLNGGLSHNGPLLSLKSLCDVVPRVLILVRMRKEKRKNGPARRDWPERGFGKFMSTMKCNKQIYKS